MRLIESNKVIPLVRLILMNHPKADAICENMQKLVDIHTIEAEPVRHGRWEWITEDIYRCTNCGTTNRVKEVMGKPDFNYCPECSADMRGRNNNGICEKS